MSKIYRYYDRPILQASFASMPIHENRSSVLDFHANANKPYYITTPIYYVNGQPHLGHAYTSVATDMLARFHRKAGHPVHFLTGTDEHGQKVQQAAEAAGVSPQAYADTVSLQFREMVNALGCSHDDFIRTTESRHKIAATKLWKALEASGQIYLGAYEGWYSVRDEAFYSETELIDGKAPTGAEVIWMKEESYFFRLSQWTQPLLAHYERHPDFICPKGSRNETIAFVGQEGGLKDLSISRSTFSWGIPVPGNPQHVMYVWLDALANYLSAVGYAAADTAGSDSGSLYKFWPASLHVIGKDILRFHCIYWPAFLLAAGLPLPRRVFAHGWWTKDGQKMSKSVGNVLDPMQLVAAHGKDPLRYFMMSEIPFGSNGDFSHLAFANRYNADLANDVGNLTQRVATLLQKHCHGRVPQPGTREVPLQPEALDVSKLLRTDLELLQACDTALQACATHATSLNLKQYCETIIDISRLGNRYIDTEAPWTQAKAGNFERVHSVLYTLVEALRRLSILLEPVIPDGAAALYAQLGVTDPMQQTFASFATPVLPGSSVGIPAPVFPRIDVGGLAGVGAEAPSTAAAAAGGAAGAKPSTGNFKSTQQKQKKDSHNPALVAS